MDDETKKLSEFSKLIEEKLNSIKESTGKFKELFPNGIFSPPKTAQSTPQMNLKQTMQSDYGSLKPETKKLYSGFTGAMALKAGITPESLREHAPQDRLATVGVLTDLALPSRVIGQLGVKLPGSGVANLMRKELESAYYRMAKLKRTPSVVKAMQQLSDKISKIK